MSEHLHPDHAGEHDGHVNVSHHHVHAPDGTEASPQCEKAFEVGN